MNQFNRFRFIYLVALHFFCAAMLIHSVATEKIKFNLGVLTKPSSSLTHYNRMLSYHRRMDALVPAGATIFIGDSITQGLATSAVASPSVNYGIGSDTTLGVINRLGYYRSIETADSVVLTIGINDLGLFGDDLIMKNYRKILNVISQETKVVVFAIFPIDKRQVESQLFTNQRIVQLNNEIKLLVEEYENTSFVNIGSLMTNTGGNLRADFHIGDGIHLSDAGYRIWINHIKATLK